MKLAHTIRAARSRFPETQLLSLDLCFILLVALLLARLAILPTSGPQGLSLFDDDFFYYFKIAENIVHGYGSTFNGLTKTNGYHPLWMIVIVVITKLIGSLSGELWTVELVISASVVAIYTVTKRTMLLFTGNSWLAAVFSLFTSLLCLLAEQGGMEIILTIPLAMTFLYLIMRPTSRWSPSRILLISFLGSAVILSRLDSILLIGLVGLALLSNQAIRTRMSVKHGLAVLFGLSPFVSYMLYDACYFDILLPISGSAKQIRSSYGISTTAYHSIAMFLSAPIHAFPLLLCVFSLIWLFCVARKCETNCTAIMIASLVFPLLQMGTVSELSDWALWPWYFYSALVPLGIALGILLCDSSWKLGRASSLRWILCGLVGFYCLHIMMAMVKSAVRSRDANAVATRVDAANFISAFADTHPGRYAMGDRSGVVGQVMKQPIVQTEGLVMDKAFLVHIRRNEDLLPVLRAYGVRYYVASVRPTASYYPCLHAIEPAQAGPTAPHMRATICAPPEATHTEFDYVTLIYDLDKNN